jgi:hypothetical protein
MVASVWAENLDLLANIRPYMGKSQCSNEKWPSLPFVYYVGIQSLSRGLGRHSARPAIWQEALSCIPAVVMQKAPQGPNWAENADNADDTEIAQLPYFL